MEVASAEALPEEPSTEPRSMEVASAGALPEEPSTEPQTEVYPNHAGPGILRHAFTSLRRLKGGGITSVRPCSLPAAATSY